MDCRQWENLLDDYLNGSLAADQRSAAEAHLDVCPACAALLAMVQKNRDALAEVDRPDLTAQILARTSGSACGRAEELLGDLVEGDLPADDAHLVRSHLEHCQQCAALERTLTWLVPLLPDMGRVEAGPAFTGDVLRATTRRYIPRSAWRGRLRDWWQGVLARPRFALEAAYVATMLLVLLCGTPISPFREASSRALQVVQAGPAQVTATLSLESPLVPSEVGRLVAGAWQATGGQVGRSAHQLSSGLSSRWRRTNDARGNLWDHIGQCGHAILSLDMVGATLQLREAGNDVRHIWQSWRGEGGRGTEVKKNRSASEPSASPSRQPLQE